MPPHSCTISHVKRIRYLGGVLLRDLPVNHCVTCVTLRAQRRVNEVRKGDAAIYYILFSLVSITVKEKKN